MLLLTGLCFISLTQAQESMPLPLNQLILESIRSMPTGGGYSAGATATQALRHAAHLSSVPQFEDSQPSPTNLVVDATHAEPSYCSGATYLVFLKVISALQNSHRVTLFTATFEALLPMGQPDGTGIWGRWNANGPGTARLFYELGLGHNFTSLSMAHPGDFLKIWWSDAIGASEHGHSVIYMGTETRNGISYLSYWSSNVPGGFGVKTVPLSRIHRMLFSRLENPDALNHIGSLPHSDRYLYSLQTRNSTVTEMNQLCGSAR